MNIDPIRNDDGTYDLTIMQGKTLSMIVNFKDTDGNAIDLTGYAGRSQIRKTPSSGEVVATFTCKILEPAYQGRLEISMSAEESANISAGNSVYSGMSKYYYDVEVYTGDPEIVLPGPRGRLFVIPEVTR